MIGDPTYANAILDRLVHNAHRIDLTYVGHWFVAEGLRGMGLLRSGRATSPLSPSWAAARPVIHYRRAANRRSRGQRWRDAAAELVVLQAEYAA